VKMSEFNVWSYLAKMGVSVKGPASRTLQEGDKVSGMLNPTFLTLEDIEEFLHTDYGEFSCQAPGCCQRFSQLHESELHYNAVHRHSCSVCRKSLPSPHLLELHIQESHDSFFAVMSERKPSYQCFLPTCANVSWSPPERHEHAIKEHNFPPDFRFDEVKKKSKPTNLTNGVSSSNGSNSETSKPKHRKKKIKEINGNSVEQPSNGSSSKLQRPLSLARLGEHFKDKEDFNGESMDVDGENRMSLCLDTMPTTTPVKDVRTESSSTGKKSKIPVRSNSCRVPRNLSFGAGIPRGFLSRPRPKSRHWHQQASCNDVSMETNIEQSDMSSLRDSLPSA